MHAQNKFTYLYLNRLKVAWSHQQGWGASTLKFSHICQHPPSFPKRRGTPHQSDPSPRQLAHVQHALHPAPQQLAKKLCAQVPAAAGEDLTNRLRRPTGTWEIRKQKQPKLVDLTWASDFCGKEVLFGEPTGLNSWCQRKGLRVVGYLDTSSSYSGYGNAAWEIAERRRRRVGTS